jgi:chromosome segregation ATPase
MEGDEMDALERAMEEISAECSRLKEQRRAVQTGAERAAERLKELSNRRTAFVPSAFSDERGITENLADMIAGLAEALDEESEALSRTKARAEDAVRELDQLIMKAEVEYHEAKKRLAQRRYEKLCKERYAHDEDAEEVVAVLIEVLDRLEGVHAQQVRAATDAEDPSFNHHDLRDTIENWLARRLHRWLSLESPESYDAPLPELDPLALKPESQQRSPTVGGVGASSSPDRSGATPAVPNVHLQNRGT